MTAVPAAALLQPAPEYAIDTKKLNLWYGTFQALYDVDLRIRQGMITSMIGPSGCGKSTLLRIVAGLLPFSAGAVRVGGRDVAGPQTDLGIVFQSPVLLDWRNVLDNVLIQIELRGLDAVLISHVHHDHLDLPSLRMLEEALAEAKRCFSCGNCTFCDNCYHYCPDLAVKRVAGGYTVDADYCKGCGICVRECPTGSMEMLEEAK